ncbi:low temperature requirement protein A [Microbacteriaceae bacterium VKM Ac-2854]|nr:low temperature requirement protein A [Microbacteriaceae bacterium VKM Ac-2854]
MSGRDPHESHRAATPLELLFDLTFVVSFGIAGENAAHLLSEGHIGPALGAFGFAMFAIGWAWINFSWFASAYDTDDWLFRILTMVQMIGVVVLALGIPALFHSINEGEHLDNTVLVLGYVIMRVALLLQWLRAAKQDPARRMVSLAYAKNIALAQVGWVVMTVLNLPLPATIVIALVLFCVEMAGPVIAERAGEKAGVGSTPWHAHHIAERYGLLTIIALGEGVFGTLAAATAVMNESGWSGEVAILVVTGIGLTFGLWWGYFTLPAGVILHRFRNRAFVWGYGHLLIFASIAATGAGLHMVQYLIEHHSEIGLVGTVLSVAIPVTVFMLTMFALYAWLVQSFDPFHLWLMLGTLALLAAGVVAAALGAPIGVCLILVTLAPFVVVVGYETVGHRHEAAVLEKALA